jgi:REP element-mobilizing transposase RayT
MLTLLVRVCVPEAATLGAMRDDLSKALPGEALAFFLTFRCFGTWLPGDVRGWTDRRNRLAESSVRSEHPGLHAQAQAAMVQEPFLLGHAHREIVEQAIRDVCSHRKWTLHAVNVRTNHVHLVIAAQSSPEHVMTSLKAWCTRRLREAGLVGEGVSPWSRHGSTRYLWRTEEVADACTYVLELQGRDLH